MTPQDHLPRIRAVATLMLPGFRQARAQLDIAVHVLEYFDQHAEHEISAGTFVTFDPPDRQLLEEIEELQSMLNAFCRLRAPPE
jgi:hypothetical protein